MNYAINRKAMDSALFGAYAIPSSELLIPDGYVSSYQNYYPYDPAKAKALLTEAGYSKGFTVSMLTPGFVGNLGTPMAEAVSQYLSAIGVTVKLTAAATGAQHTTDLTSGNFAVWNCGGCGAQPTWQFYSQFLEPGGVVNQHGWSDPVLASLWQKGSTAANPAPYWQKIMVRTVTQADFIPLGLLDKVIYAKKGVGGLSITANRYGYIFANELSLK
jgi:peptide/nickel transport system substrate-binding protein